MYIERRVYNLPKIRDSATIESMRASYEVQLNPGHYPLSSEGKRRLKWIYEIEYETRGRKIARAAKSIGISRQHLSNIYNIWIRNSKDPRCLEPESRRPHSTSNRKRIGEDIEEKIVELKKKHPCFGKEKIYTKLKESMPEISICPTTVNNYMKKYKLVNMRISEKNKKAAKNKKELVYKMRPPAKIKDLKPGALVEKDMKYIPKFSNTEYPFWFQQTMIDSFTRIRVLEMTSDYESISTAKAHKEAAIRFPFAIACENTDSGSENGGAFNEHLKGSNIVHFYSRTGTPTDNPRVERSHLTDQVEFYGQGNVCKDFESQREALKEWEHFYNYDRPNQALSYLTPMQFYELWKKEPEKAYKITSKWQQYLRRQRRRQAESRQMKRKDQTEALMHHIDAVLTPNSYY